MKGSGYNVRPMATDDQWSKLVAREGGTPKERVELARVTLDIRQHRLFVHDDVALPHSLLPLVWSCLSANMVQGGDPHLSRHAELGNTTEIQRGELEGWFRTPCQGET